LDSSCRAIFDRLAGFHKFRLAENCRAYFFGGASQFDQWGATDGGGHAGGELLVSPYCSSIPLEVHHHPSGAPAALQAQRKMTALPLREPVGQRVVTLSCCLQNRVTDIVVAHWSLIAGLTDPIHKLL
jgi:hypothetical protein